MTNQNKMREQFEEECADWEMDTSRDSEGDYVDRQTRRGWNLWQAATAYAGAATPKAAQGGVGGRLHQIAEPAGDELPESVIDGAAQPAAMLTRAQIRDVFLSNGFTIKEGQTDLKEYVYEAAYALLALAAAPQPPARPAPATQGESEYQRGYRHGYDKRCAEVQGALL